MNRLLVARHYLLPIVSAFLILLALSGFVACETKSRPAVEPTLSSSPFPSDRQAATTETPVPPTASPTKSSGGQATPTAKVQAIATPSSTLKASYVQLTDDSTDKAAIWVNNDTVRFYRGQDIGGFIGELHLNSGDLTLSSLPRNLDVETFHWSPQGKYLLMRQRGWMTNADPKLWLYNTSTHELTEVPTPDLVLTRTIGIAWTQDESSVLVLETAMSSEENYIPDTRRRLMKIDIERRSTAQFADLRPFTKDSNYSLISISPVRDEALLSNVLPPGARNSSNLLRLNTKTGEISELPVRGSYDVKWSSDGSRVAFYALSAPETAPIEDMDQAIWVSSPSGGDARAILRDGNPLGWLPDGQHLLLADLRLIDVDTGEVTQLAISNDQALPEIWEKGQISPDGKKVLVRTRQGLGMITMGE